MKWEDEIRAKLKDCADITIEDTFIDKRSALLIYVQGLVDPTHLQDKILPYFSNKLNSNVFLSSLDIEQACHSIMNGHIIIYFYGANHLYDFPAKGEESRSIQEPQNEAVIRGPRDGFNEFIFTNTSLLRRRLPDPNLKVSITSIGQRTKTKIALCYVEGIVNPEILAEVQRRLDSMDIDHVLDSGTIEQWIEDSWYSPFPQVQYTERPDKVVASMLEGRIAILVDGTPISLIVPVTFSMLLQAPDEYYERWLIGTAMRIIRVIATIISLVLPSLYIALVSFHPGMIPTRLTISIAAARATVPFPSILEALMMEVTLEMLREAGLRLPKVIGQTVGIVGGLVIGESAVKAGIVSPVMVIVVAITAICSFLVPAYNASIPLRLLRFPLMILAGTLGIFGVILGLLFILAHLVSLKSFGVNYFSPIVPYRIKDWKDLIVRAPLVLMDERPEMLHPLDQKRLNINKRKKGW